MSDDIGDERSGLDDDLRRLFSDERLTVPVADGADRAVVAGAHRRHRQRLTVAAAGGVIAVVAVVTVGLGLSGVIRGPSSAVTAASPPQSLTLTTTTTTSPSPSQSAVADDVLGPYGVGFLRLGMVEADVKSIGAKSGSIGMSSSGGATCETMVVTIRRDGHDFGSVPADAPPPISTTTAAQPAHVVSPYTKPTVPGDAQRNILPLTVQVTMSMKSGVVRIGGSMLHTPEGIGIGSRLDEIMAVYRDVRRPQTQVQAQRYQAIQVPVPDNPAALYVFDLDKDGTVVDLWLEYAHLPC